MSFKNFTTQTKEEIFTELQSNENGLSQKEVLARQRKFGLNKVTTHQITWSQIFLRQFRSPFIFLLFIAAVISFSLGERLDSLIIFTFVFIAITLSFIQEYHSEKALVALRDYIRGHAKVCREGKEEEIDSQELVPGDIVFLETGDLIPADVRFINEQNLLVNESILTGESVPIKKIALKLKKPVSETYEALNIGFSGTTVSAGKGEGIVIGTGSKTAFGEISKLTIETERESTFQKSIARLSKFILIFMLATIILVFLGNLLIKGKEANLAEFLIFSIALTVSVIPEALPVVTTLSLSRGALNLAKKKVVARRLSAIEDLGSIEVLCVDKTGTLTENILTVAEIKAENKEKCLFYGLLASSLGNPFDQAIRKAAKKEILTNLSAYKKIEELPFDPERKRGSVLVRKGEESELIVRGAPEVILKLCPNLEKKQKEELKNWCAEQGRNGKRVLGIAAKKLQAKDNYNLPRKTFGLLRGLQEEERNLSLIGLISFFDPIKKTAKEALNLAQKLGVEIKILTGDADEVAAAVATKIGLIASTKEVITGEELESLDKRSYQEAVEKGKVFARVTPTQKYEIIKVLKGKYEVGFLGEGINDAPALKIANVALAVKGACDITEEAADVILLKKSLHVIVDGIKEGRMIFANTIKYILTTLISNFGNFFAIAAISLLVNFLPMLPIQILLLNLLTDFPMILIAMDSVDAIELKRPKQYEIRKIAQMAIVLGLVSTFYDFTVFNLFRRFSPQTLQTLWFTASVLTELALIFSIRTRLLFLKAKRPSLPLLGFAGVASLTALVLPFSTFGQMVFHLAAPKISSLIAIFVLVSLYFATSEIVKLFYYSKTKPK